VRRRQGDRQEKEKVEGDRKKETGRGKQELREGDRKAEKRKQS
jgi:hypothetical protein